MASGVAGTPPKYGGRLGFPKPLQFSAAFEAMLWLRGDSQF